MKTLTNRTITLDVSSSTTIVECKEKINDKEGIPIQSQRLLLKEDELEDGKTLGDYKISNGAELLLVLKLVLA